jgi:hypothetical protein
LDLGLEKALPDRRTKKKSTNASTFDLNAWWFSDAEEMDRSETYGYCAKKCLPAECNVRFVLLMRERSECNG